MVEYRLVENYFKKLEENSSCQIEDQVSARKYCFTENNKRAELVRYLIDDNLDAGISKLAYDKILKIEHIEGSDLLIIGFCLSGKKIINYRGRQTVAEGEVFYFRPGEDFELEIFAGEFLYYFLDLSHFKDFMHCRRSRCQFKTEECTSYVDSICEPGELVIEKVPYAMEVYAGEIREIREMEIHNFLDYTSLKGDLFKYLNWFMKHRMTGRRKLNKKKYGLCYAKKAKKLIRENRDEDLTVREIAEILDISSYRLQKSFRKVEGTTVYNYILQEKINRSKRLLGESDLSIMDISLKVGYENPSKFSTAFKDITGSTPSEYRKNKLD